MNDVSPLAENRRVSDKTFTLLCIDDETVNLKVLASIFKEQYRVVVSKSASQGLAKALEVIPDLILLDVQMPKENGFELIVKLKNHPELSHIPVIFITGLQSSINEEKGLVLGACDYIHKPFNYGIVKARVNTHIEVIRQRRLLERLANFDSLTELPNRRKWQQDSEEKWQLAQSMQQNITIGIIDIDFFKKYNDHYGHQQGDFVLRKVANIIRRIIFEHHGDVYRCGGEEFYLYLSNQNIEKIEAILNSCIQRVTQLAIEHQNSQASDFISISIGAVLVNPNKNISLNNAITAADEQLYQVKNSSRNAAKLVLI